MKKLHPTTQYKKDYKRFRNNPNKLKLEVTSTPPPRMEEPYAGVFFISVYACTLQIFVNFALWDNPPT